MSAAMREINGYPVHASEGWVVLHRCYGQDHWEPWPGTYQRTRARAIASLPTWFDYEKHRRAGEAIAVHAVIDPLCLPETAGDADRRGES